MPEYLTYSRTRELAEQVVDEFGADHVYQDREDGGCFYVRDGGPDCLVAHVLTRAGVPLAELAALDNLDGHGEGGAGVRANRAVFERWAEPAAVDLLADAQDQQDGGATWGHALDFALEQQIGEVE